MNKWTRRAIAFVIGVVLGMAYNWAFAAPRLPSAEACEMVGNAAMTSLALRQGGVEDNKALVVLDLLYTAQFENSPQWQQLFRDVLPLVHRFTGREEFRALSPLVMETLFTQGCQLHRGNLDALLGVSL